MSLYAHPHVRGSGSMFGYAYAWDRIQHSLAHYSYRGERLSVDLNSPKAKVQMFFGAPPGAFYNHQYKIQMTQWESTIAPLSWASAPFDEFWTANDFGRQAIINCGVPSDKVFVYEHGVDADVWTPRLRGQSDKIRFLQTDCGGPRKRADVSLAAFKAAFGDDPDYELVLKYSGPGANGGRPDLEDGRQVDGNVTRIFGSIPLQDLVDLHHACDVTIYPTEGEGFGFIPLQAVFTGMPTITTGRWCSYEKYLGGNIIESRLGPSPIQEHYHRDGDVVVPDFDSTVELMRYVADNIDKQSRFFFEQVPDVAAEYSWTNKTKIAMDSFIDRVGVEALGNYRDYLAS